MSLVTSKGNFKTVGVRGTTESAYNGLSSKKLFPSVTPATTPTGPTSTGYDHKVKTCVSGENIIKYEDKSIDECKDICTSMPECAAFEYGVAHGGGDTTTYKPRDC